MHDLYLLLEALLMISTYVTIALDKMANNVDNEHNINSIHSAYSMVFIVNSLYLTHLNKMEGLNFLVYQFLKV